MVGVMFNEEDVKRMNRVVKARRESVSVLVRRAVLRELARFSPLPEFDRVALEVSDQSAQTQRSGSDRP